MEINFDARDIVFETRGEAEEVRDRLNEIADTYACATVADLKDLSGIIGTWTATKMFWTPVSLKHAEINRVREGWIINLPAPIIRDSSTYNPTYTSKPARVSYRDYSSHVSETKTEPKPLWITINTEEIDDIEFVLTDLFNCIETVTDRDIHLTIT